MFNKTDDQSSGPDFPLDRTIGRGKVVAVQYILSAPIQSVTPADTTAIPASKTVVLPNSRELAVRAVANPDPDSMFSTGYDLYGRVFDPLSVTDYNFQLTSEFFGADPSAFGVVRNGSSGDFNLVYQDGLGQRYLETVSVLRDSTGDGSDDTFRTDELVDRITGGGGVDTVSYATSRMAVQVDLAMSGPQVSTGAASGDILVSIRNVIGGTFGDTLAGNGDDNVLTGGRGADTLRGEGGSDTASYSTSNAVQVDLRLNGPQAGTGDAVGDVLVSIENLIGSRFADTLTGNNQTVSILGAGGNDTLTGGNGANHLDGGIGNDMIFGEGGNDVLTGGASDDMLDGGAGYDTASYADATAGVTVNLALTTQQNTGGAGRDTLIAIESVLGSDFADKLTGNGAANTLQGGGGQDTLDGGAAGRDVLEGGADDDTYMVGHAGVTIVETSGQGADVVMASVNFVLPDNVETLVLSGAALIRGYGNEGDNSITASGGSDELRGYGGDDVLIAGAGRDRLVGDDGHDTFVFAHISDIAVGSSRDAIADFVQGEDLIDLRGVASETGHPLVFSDASTFSGVPGEIVARAFGQGTLVSGDLNGDQRTDFEFSLQTHVNLAASDFLL